MKTSIKQIKFLFLGILCLFIAGWLIEITFAVKKQKIRVSILNFTRSELMLAQEIAQISPDEFALLDSISLSRLSTTQLNILSQEQFRSIQSKISFKQIIQMDPKHVSWLTAEIMKWFSPEQIRQLSKEQIARLYPEQFKMIQSRLSLQQIIGLSKVQTQFLTSDTLGQWDASQIQSLPGSFWKNLNAEQVHFLERFLTPAQILHLDGTLIPLLAPETLYKLEPEQIQQFSASQLIPATSPQFQMLAPHLSFRQIMQLPALRLREIPGERLRILTPNQLAFLKKSGKINLFSSVQIMLMNTLLEKGQASTPLIRKEKK